MWSSIPPDKCWFGLSYISSTRPLCLILIRYVCSFTCIPEDLFRSYLFSCFVNFQSSAHFYENFLQYPFIFLLLAVYHLHTYSSQFFPLYYIHLPRIHTVCLLLFVYVCKEAEVPTRDVVWGLIYFCPLSFHRFVALCTSLPSVTHTMLKQPVYY